MIIFFAASGRLEFTNFSVEVIMTIVLDSQLETTQCSVPVTSKQVMVAPDNQLRAEQ